MAELTPNGMNFRWSSLGREERRDLAWSMAGFGLAGFLAGFGNAYFQRMDQVPLTAANILFILSPLLPVFLAAYFLFRFSARQDELYRRMESLACRYAVNVAMLVAAIVGLLEHQLRTDLVGIVWIIPVMLLAGGVGWMVAARRYV
ncbi:MAG TPA: hypothetical protein VED40_17820 [Azospirillaceae bacterium]|nr:hypothetical protein [Azospirillaceae bacterium]